MAEGKSRIKIIEVSGKGCAPCKELREEVESLSSKYNIDLVVVDADSFSLKDMLEAFGTVEVIPTTFIESEGKAKKIVGYTEGDITKAIEEMLKPAESGDESEETDKAGA